MSRPRRIVILAAPGLRRALVEQLALQPDFEVAEAASVDDVETIVAGGALDILLLDADIGLGLARTARERFAGPIFLIGEARTEDRGQDRDDDRPSRRDGDLDGAPPAPDRNTPRLSIEPIARPVRFADLLLRLRAGGAPREVVIGARRFRPGAFELLDEAGRRAPLTEKEAAILSRLVEADGEIVTKEILLRDVWGYRPDVTTRTLETHLSRLRRKIESAAGARLLLSEKSGYRLIFRHAAEAAEQKPDFEKGA